MSLKMSTTDDVARASGGGLVEVTGRRGAPVDQQLRLVLVEEPDTPDVASGRVVHIKASETEPLLDAVQLCQSILVERGKRVPFRTGLRRPRRASSAYRLQVSVGAVAHHVEPTVEDVEIGLLSLDL